MAKITFTADDGSVQEFVLTTSPVVTAVEVDVKESDGTEEVFTPKSE